MIVTDHELRELIERQKLLTDYDRPGDWNDKDSLVQPCSIDLPNATGTKIVFSANGRALRHFLNVRGGIPGDLEMRRVAALIFTRLETEAPALLSGFEMNTCDDGYPIVRPRSVA